MTSGRSNPEPDWWEKKLLQKHIPIANMVMRFFSRFLIFHLFHCSLIVLQGVIPLFRSEQQIGNLGVLLQSPVKLMHSFQECQVGVEGCAVSHR